MARGLMPTDDKQSPPSDAGMPAPMAPPRRRRNRSPPRSLTCSRSRVPPLPPPRGGRLDRETVEALDVVTHALVFVGHPHGLDLWRDALWGRRLSAGARRLSYGCWST